MIYIGIDPGAKGNLAAIYNDKNIGIIIPFDENDYIQFMKIINKDDCVCALEHVGAMPGQGVVSMFNFGQNFGFIQGILKTLEIPYQLVRPAKWKKEFGITKDKNTSIEVCKRLFPDISLKRTKKCKKDDDNIAESILLAEWARRKL